MEQADRPVADEAEVGGPPTHAAIAALAYDYWEARGGPLGSPEVDWLLAEEHLLADREAVAQDTSS